MLLPWERKRPLRAELGSGVRSHSHQLDGRLLGYGPLQATPGRLWFGAHHTKPPVWVNCFFVHCSLSWVGVGEEEERVSWSPYRGAKDHHLGKRTTTGPVLSLLGPALGVTQQQDGLDLFRESLGGVGRLFLTGCALGCWEGTGRRLQHGAASSSAPLLPSTNPLGLLKCATCRSLKGLFLCLDHKIAKEQWLSFKTAA